MAHGKKKEKPSDPSFAPSWLGAFRFKENVGYCHDGAHFVVLQISGRTNERRASVKDPRHARHRTDCALVLYIYDMKNGRAVTQAEKMVWWSDTAMFTVNTLVTLHDFDMNPDNVRSSGLSFFRDPEIPLASAKGDADFCWTREDGTKFGRKDGKRFGFWRTFYDNGQVKDSTEHADGMKNGRYLSFYDNGNDHVVGYYRDDLRQDDWTMLYVDGIVCSGGRYLDDCKNGVHVTFHPDGKRRSVEMYCKGKQNEDSTIFDENGHVVGREFYDSGKHIATVRPLHPAGRRIVAESKTRRFTL